MVLENVQYLPGVQDEEHLERRHLRNKIRIIHLKATIVVLSLALVTVSAILVWQLLTKQHGCRNKGMQNRSGDHIQSLNPVTKSFPWKVNLQCPPAINKDSLPYDFPVKIEEILEDVGNSLKQQVEKKLLVSISSSAFYKDQTVWKAGFGIIDKSSYPQQVPDDKTLYRTGSLVKLLTTLMTFKLLQDKEIDCLDDPLKKYFTKFYIDNPFNNDAITIRQILSHTSGLPREVPCGPSFSSKLKNVCPVNTTYVSQQLRTMKLKFAPGTSVGYSNLGYALLGHSLFERFGIGYSSWEDWVFYKILNPIGMTNTILDNNRYFSNVAVSYKDNGVITPTLNWGWSSPAFQMSTTTADLTKLMMALVNSENTFLHEGIIREMITPVFIYPDHDTIFSCGWQIHNQNSLRVVSKAGAIPGSSAAIFFIPDLRFGFILLSTGQEIAPKLSREISKKLTKAFFSNSIGSTSKIKSPPISSIYIGNYILANKWSDKVHAKISMDASSGHLKLHQDPGYPSSVYLSFVNFHLLQIIYPSGLSCQDYALGQDKEFLRFHRETHSPGRFKHFTLGSFVFERVS